MFKARLSVLCFAVASLLTLSSCDAYEAAYDETLNDNAPQIVIAGGFKMDIQGNSVPVEEFDKCTQSTIQGIVGHEK
ncbi:hypothetical protein OLZ31_23650 [Enterobacter asburiae]|nr:hypothetical protein [Enterobacter asburiae]